MIKIFKIIEKVVWTLIAIAVIMILALIAISVANSADNIWNDFRPYTSLLYGVAMLVVAFKAVILGVQMYLETKIEEKTKHLQTIIEKQQSQQVKQEKKVSSKLDKIINDIAAIPNTDTDAIVDFHSLKLRAGFLKEPTHEHENKIIRINYYYGNFCIYRLDGFQRRREIQKQCQLC